MNGPCPVCASAFCAYVRDVPTVRTRREIPLYGCLECRSFWNPSGYTESDEQRQRDADWGASVAERNRRAATGLFDAVLAAGVAFDSVCEVGCGIGTLLEVARERGNGVSGFDLNEYAIARAAEKGLPVQAETWTAQTDTGPVGLYVCISVLEHIQEPRKLLADLCTAAQANAAALYVSVPFLEKGRWDYILDPDPRRAGTPFFDNDVHVTHFSLDGLTRALSEFGQEDVRPLNVDPWGGVLVMPRRTQP